MIIQEKAINLQHNSPLDWNMPTRCAIQLIKNFIGFLRMTFHLKSAVWLKMTYGTLIHSIWLFKLVLNNETMILLAPVEKPTCSGSPLTALWRRGQAAFCSSTASGAQANSGPLRWNHRPWQGRRRRSRNTGWVWVHSSIQHKMVRV